MPNHRPLTVFAPAKINLYLHVTGKRDDGFHLLDSLIVFADIGDKVTFEAANDFSFQINGPYANAFTSKDRDDSSASSNLAVRAAWVLSREVKRDLAFRMILTKNLPLAAGIGGGSSDAAAVLWGLIAHWGIPISSAWLPGLMMGLGADVPACLRCLPVRVIGAGDFWQAAPALPEIPVVLLNPGKHCATPDVFRRFTGPLRQQAEWPDDLSTPKTLIDFLGCQNNDLTDAASEIVPEIATGIQILNAQPGCQLARMSGSGASVFGLFETLDQAQDAVAAITIIHPTWWVRAGTINNPQRY